MTTGVIFPISKKMETFRSKLPRLIIYEYKDNLYGKLLMVVNKQKTNKRIYPEVSFNSFEALLNSLE